MTKLVSYAIHPTPEGVALRTNIIITLLFNIIILPIVYDNYI